MITSEIVWDNSPSAPKISVLTPIWRLQHSYFEDCLASLELQSLPLEQFELVVCFDGTPLAERELALEMLKTSRLQYRAVRLRAQMGMATARNAAAANAKGEWLSLLDHDDQLNHHALATLLHAVTPSAELIYSDYESIDAHGQVFFCSNARPYQKLLGVYGSLEWENPLFHATFILQAMLIRTARFVALGGFSVSAGLAHEVDFRQRLFSGNNISYVSEALYRYVKRDNSVYHTRYEELVADTCRVMLSNFKRVNPEAIGCLRVGKINPSFVTHYKFFSINGEISPPRWVDYDSMQLK